MNSSIVSINNTYSSQHYGVFPTYRKESSSINQLDDENSLNYAIQKMDSQATNLWTGLGIFLGRLFGFIKEEKFETEYNDIDFTADDFTDEEENGFNYDSIIFSYVHPR